MTFPGNLFEPDGPRAAAFSDRKRQVLDRVDYVEKYSRLITGDEKVEEDQDPIPEAGHAHYCQDSGGFGHRLLERDPTKS